MSFNMYTQIPKIRDALLLKGYEKDIPWEVLVHEIMMVGGMHEDTAKKWMHNYEKVGKITITEKGKVNFV